MRLGKDSEHKNLLLRHLDQWIATRFITDDAGVKTMSFVGTRGQAISTGELTCQYLTTLAPAQMANPFYVGRAHQALSCPATHLATSHEIHRARSAMAMAPHCHKYRLA